MKALVRAQHEQWLWCESEVEHLKLLIAKLQRIRDPVSKADHGPQGDEREPKFPGKTRNDECSQP
ncbi:MAG: hypothetical protein ABR988_17575 [Terriglobales bacterium]